MTAPCCSSISGDEKFSNVHENFLLEKNIYDCQIVNYIRIFGSTAKTTQWIHKLRLNLPT